MPFDVSSYTKKKKKEEEKVTSKNKWKQMKMQGKRQMRHNSLSIKIFCFKFRII